MTAHFVTLLDQLRRRSLRMASHVEDIVQEAVESVFTADESLARRVITRDAEVDNDEVEVEAEVIRLMALYQPVGSDLRLLCTVLKVNSDLERISDCAVNIAERARHLEVQALATRNATLQQMCPLVRRLLRNAIHAYSMEDGEVARKLREQDDEIDECYANIVKQIIRDAAADSGQMAGYLDVLSVAKNLERLADHAINIAEEVIYLTTGTIIRHQGSDPEHAKS
ncbi:MAG: phosphate signaling complex protein PhoU [Phycisphaerae bacterium]|jgi:phosphate transport system protein